MNPFLPTASVNIDLLMVGLVLHVLSCLHPGLVLSQFLDIMSYFPPCSFWCTKEKGLKKKYNHETINHPSRIINIKCLVSTQLSIFP